MCVLTLLQGAPVRARVHPGQVPWSAVHRCLDPEKRNQPQGRHWLEGIVGVRAVRESLQLPPSRWRTSDRCTEASQPAGSLKVTRVIYLENAPFVTGEIRPVNDGQSAGR